MKKALFVAAALAALTFPALAQQSATGQSSGGPGRVGTPGQIGGGVPGARPGMMARPRMMRPRMMKPRMMRPRMMRRPMMRRPAKRMM